MSTQNIHTIFKIKNRKITIYYPKFADMGFYQGTQKRVRNIHGKRAISVRATEGLLYLLTTLTFYSGCSILGQCQLCYDIEG